MSPGRLLTGRRRTLATTVRSARDFNPRINPCVQREGVAAAYRVVTKMEEAGVAPDTTTFNSLVNLYVGLEDAWVVDEMNEAGSPRPMRPLLPS